MLLPSLTARGFPGLFQASSMALGFPALFQASSVPFGAAHPRAHLTAPVRVWFLEEGADPLSLS